MAVMHHHEHFQDRAAMLAMRAALAFVRSAPLAPESRPGFDELIAKTPTARVLHQLGSFASEHFKNRGSERQIHP